MYRAGRSMGKERTDAAGANNSFVWTFARPASEPQPHAVRVKIAAIVGVETTHARLAFCHRPHEDPARQPVAEQQDHASLSLNSVHPNRAQKRAVERRVRRSTAPCRPV